MVPISAVIITLNEEQNIARCIQSVKEIANEILVVDSFSTDKTKEICNELGVRFMENKFEGFIEQQNFAIAQATNNIVLSIDADEAVSDELKKSILKVKDNWAADGYTFNRLTSYCSKWVYTCGWYPDKKLRLYDRSKGKWDGNNPHYSMKLVPGSKILHLEGDLLHYTYKTIHDHINTTIRYSDIMAKDLIKKGKKSSTFRILFSPLFKFIKLYFIKKGFLAGWTGLVISLTSSYGTFLKYYLVRYYNNGQKV
jgi:glycosyltransferase involved in cell wall biosynthesis